MGPRRERSQHHHVYPGCAPLLATLLTALRRGALLTVGLSASLPACPVCGRRHTLAGRAKAAEDRHRRGTARVISAAAATAAAAAAVDLRRRTVVVGTDAVVRPPCRKAEPGHAAVSKQQLCRKSAAVVQEVIVGAGSSAVVGIKHVGAVGRIDAEPEVVVEPKPHWTLSSKVRGTLKVRCTEASAMNPPNPVLGALCLRCRYVTGTTKWSGRLATAAVGAEARARFSMVDCTYKSPTMHELSAWRHLFSVANKRPGCPCWPR